MLDTPNWIFITLPSAGFARRGFHISGRAEGSGAGDPASRFRVTVPPNPAEMSCDILIAGAGMGGVSAAITASKRGHQVCLTEETIGWRAGDCGRRLRARRESLHRDLGRNRTYVQFRRGIRDYYRSHYKLSPAAIGWENLNPGSCYVSPLCFEPKGALRCSKDAARPSVDVAVADTDLFA